MEKRILGIILTIAGAGGLLYAGIEFVNGNGNDHVKKIVMYAVLGLIFFLAGIGLLKSTRDRTNS